MNITLNDTITVNNAAGNAVELNITGWTPEFIAYGLAYFHGVRMQRCTASVEKVDFVKTRQAMFDSMAAGEIPSGGGGGGPRLSIEDAGMIAYFNSKGSPVRIAKQVANGKNLDQYIASFVQKAIWPSVAKAISGMPKDEQIVFHKTKLPELVKTNTAKVLAVAQKDKTGMGAFIEAETKKREGTKDTGFAVEIEISL
jgi:hypothetical protein